VLVVKLLDLIITSSWLDGSRSRQQLGARVDQVTEADKDWMDEAVTGPAAWREPRQGRSNACSEFELTVQSRWGRSGRDVKRSRGPAHGMLLDFWIVSAAIVPCTRPGT